MTIEIERDPQDEDVCTVKIDNNVSPVEIETILAIRKKKHPGLHCPKVIQLSKVEDWVRKIKNSPDKIIGISPEYSTHYKDNNYYSYLSSKSRHISYNCYHILQFCVGNQCLLYDPGDRDPKKFVPKALKDVLSSGKFTVVGVGMEEVVKNLEENLELKISRSRDLGEMAGLAHDVGDLYCNKKRRFSVVKLAERVLKEDWAKGTNRNGICWCRGRSWATLSDEKVKYGTLDALLAFKMGKKLIEYA